MGVSTFSINNYYLPLQAVSIPPTPTFCELAYKRELPTDSTTTLAQRVAISPKETQYLPADLLKEIFSFLDIKSMRSCSFVCSEWNILLAPSVAENSLATYHISFSSIENKLNSMMESHLEAIQTEFLGTASYNPVLFGSLMDSKLRDLEGASKALITASEQIASFKAWTDFVLSHATPKTKAEIEPLLPKIRQLKLYCSARKIILIAETTRLILKKSSPASQTASTVQTTALLSFNILNSIRLK